MASISSSPPTTVRPANCPTCGLRRYLCDDQACASTACDGDSYFSTSLSTPDRAPILPYQDGRLPRPSPKLAPWARAWATLKEFMHLSRTKALK